MDTKTPRMNSRLPSVMKAWQYTNARGCLEKNLHVNDAATLPRPPALGSEDIMIEVISMALNPADYKLAELPLVNRLFVSKPASPGLDFCGRVVSCIDGKVDLHNSQLLNPFIKAPRSGVVPLPAGFDVDQAAGIATAALTAYQSLVPYVKNGDRVFINGSSGGVGIFAIQIAKILGCHIVVSCSGANAHLCKDLGADEVIDYTTSDISQTLKSRGQVFDLLVDNVSRPYDLHKASDHFLQGKAPFIQVAAADDSLRGAWSMVPRWMQPRWPGGGKHPWHLLMVKNSVDELAHIGQWVREGKLKVILDSVFEFEDAPKAFERLRTRRARGKVVINVTERPPSGQLNRDS